MKHYLDLVPIAEKVHRKQSRMSVICIVLSVFLVTTIFGMADMFVRSQILQSQRDDGNWHVGLKNISSEDAALMAVRPDIAMLSPYGTLNFGANLGYTMGGKEVVIFGTDENCVTKIFPDMLTEGSYPQAEGGALVTENAREMMGLQIGDEVTVSTPDGAVHSYQVTGFLGNAPGLMRHDAYGLFLCMEDYYAIYPGVTEGTSAGFDIMYYVQFSSTGNIQGKIREIKSVFQLSDSQVAENTKLLGLLGQSRDSFMMFIYAAAGILFVLVMCAGILMIASSLNSNVAQRTEFFGLMRCIGAVIHRNRCHLGFVRNPAVSEPRLLLGNARLRPEHTKRGGRNPGGTADSTVCGSLPGQARLQGLAAGSRVRKRRGYTACPVCGQHQTDTGGYRPGHPPRRLQPEKLSAHDRLLRLEHRPLPLLLRDR